MSTPSLPLILFAVADAVARSGMPEPTEVNYDPRYGLRLEFDARVREDLDVDAAGLRWAKRVGIDVKDTQYAWRTREHDHDGVRVAITRGYGKWHGVEVYLRCLRPVTAPVESSAVAA